jgi:hypothetical protein
MVRAFSPHFVFQCVTWGVAPGWFEVAPLALAEASATCPDSRRGSSSPANDITKPALFQRVKQPEEIV